MTMLAPLVEVPLGARIHPDRPQPDPVDLHVGRAIRARRQAVGLSQEALAKAIGLSFQQVQKYERAANRVSCSMLAEIAAALNCAPAEFLPAAQIEPGPPSAALRLAAERGGLALAEAYLSLDTPRRACLLNVAQAMLDKRPRKDLGA